MDERVRRHAEIIVDHCTDVRAEDHVLVVAPAAASDLVVALYERLGERGARPSLGWSNARAHRAYVRAMAVGDFRTNDAELAAMRETDVIIFVSGPTNVAETSDVDPATTAAASRAAQPILEERLEKRWVITAHPTPGAAQKAGLSTAAWEDFVYGAVDRDWAAQAAFQAQLVDVLDAGAKVHLVSGDTTDLRLDIDGMRTVNDDGRLNLPGGEVYTSPNPDSAEGVVTFDQPLVHSGRELRDVRLTFEGGEVVDYAASQHEDLLASILETDEGARRLGELGIGMNRAIDRFSYNMLFDEKMGDTIHLALGNAIAECVPDDRTFNASAQHVDMLVDMSRDSRIEVDGEVVQRDGTFAFEDGFEG